MGSIKIRNYTLSYFDVIIISLCLYGIVNVARQDAVRDIRDELVIVKNDRDLLAEELIMMKDSLLICQSAIAGDQYSYDLLASEILPTKMITIITEDNGGIQMAYSLSCKDNDIVTVRPSGKKTPEE